MAVLPTGFGKNIYLWGICPLNDKADPNQTPSIVVIVPLRSIIEDQIRSNDYNLRIFAFEKKENLLKDMTANKYQVIYASVQRSWVRIPLKPPEFLRYHKSSVNPPLKEPSLSINTPPHTRNVLEMNKPHG